MSWVLVVFVVVYVGMALGHLPGGLQLDRAGIALLGAIGLVATGDLSVQSAWNAIDPGTVALLFGLMVLSAHLHTAGFYAEVTRRLEFLKMGPRGFLAVLVALSGVLGALLTNDVIALAMAPVLVDICRSKRYNPVPFLIALACSTNAGSVATIMGSPQNILVGEQLKLSFAGFAMACGVPAIVSLAVVWAVVAVLYRDRLVVEQGPAGAAPVEGVGVQPVELTKGLVLGVLLVACFLFTDWSRGGTALAVAGLLLLNRHFRSRKLLDLVDWQLLVLFIGLFVVNGALQQAGYPARWLAGLQHAGIDPSHPSVLYLVTAVLSDLVSNVPAVMLLLPFAKGALAAPALVLGSGLSSNLILIGSMANLIVVDAAARKDVRISFAEHAKTGVPVTLLTLALAAVWLVVYQALAIR